MKKVAVLGLGKSGISAAHFLQKMGYDVVGIDDKLVSKPDFLTIITSEDASKGIQDFDFVVTSPGIAPTHPVIVAAKNVNIDVFCDVELAFRTIAKRHIHAVGITGSNGKTTTTSLTCHMLLASGISASAVGNIGNPILTEVETTNDTLVIELSSFQLETMTTKALDAACILNITPNHLDRHGTMEEYTKAKMQIAEVLKPEGEFWVQQQFATTKKALRFGFEKDCDLYTDGVKVFRFGKYESDLPQELQHSKSHNVENYLAAYALARFYGADAVKCMQSYSTFNKPKHRLQFIRTHNGIHYYDDSKATSIDAVLRAVESITNPIVLIAGGVHKGYPYGAWQKAFTGKVKACVLIGQAADIIERDLEQCVPVIRAGSFEDAVVKALECAVAQDAVVLSPGCASYDMFTSFEERGNKFQQIVNNLP